MKIVLGENTKNNRDFANLYGAILTSEMCGIKNLKEEVEIFIPYERILENGMITNTIIFIEEVLLTLNVKKVFISQENSEYIKNIASYYDVEFYTDFSV